jgi:hypothetical protein
MFSGSKNKNPGGEKNKSGGVENVSKHRIYFRGQIKKFRIQKKNPRTKNVSAQKRYFYGQISKILEYFPTWPSIGVLAQAVFFVPK